MSDLDRTIELYSILSDNPEKSKAEVLNMDVALLGNELSKIQFITKKYKAKTPNTYYIIDGEEYTVQLSLRGMTAAQYIDFQNFYKEYDKNFKYIFWCFLIPAGKKYNDGYDVMELAERLYDKIPITIVTDIMVFFCRLFKSLTVATLISSIRETKKMLKKAKDWKEKYRLRRMLVQMRNTVDLLQNEIELAG